MRRKLNSLLRLKRNETGTTLIELLAATVIFLLVIIPMSGMYIKGANMYTQTVNEVSLQNELDFVTADVMKKLQNASYFDLSNFDTNDPAYGEADKVFQLFQSDHLDSLIPGKVPGIDPLTFNKNLFQPILSTYSIQVTMQDGQPISKVAKSIYQFQESAHTNSLFSYNKTNYMVYGFFELDPTSSYQKVNLYLLIAPKSPNPSNYNKSSFKDLEDLKQYILANKPPYEFIRVSKTQLSVNHNQQG